MDNFLMIIVLFSLTLAGSVLGLAVGKYEGERRGRKEVFAGLYVCEKLGDNSIHCYRKNKVKD